MSEQAMVNGFGTISHSENDKLRGYRTKRKVYATYRAVGPTCPSTCALLPSQENQTGGCYAKQGNCGIHQKRADETKFDCFDWIVSRPQGSIIRFNVTGDVVGSDGPVYREAIRSGMSARPDLKAWLYTHAWADLAIQAWRDTLPANVTLIASADNEAEAIQAMLAGFQTVSIVRQGTKAGNWDQNTAKISRAHLQYLADTFGKSLVTCPAQREDRKQVGCADCLACTKSGIIAFAAHGIGKTKALRSLSLKVLSS